jgi:DNA-binding MarR family transcriptional regulator
MSSPPNSLADETLRLLEVFRTFELTFSRWAKSLVEAEGGSPARMRLLAALHCKGARIMRGLHEELGVTARQVTNLVDALEAEGLVGRTPHASDRRATVVTLTHRGAELMDATLGPFRHKIAGPFRELDESDRRELLRLMEKLIAALNRRVQEKDQGCDNLSQIPLAGRL